MLRVKKNALYKDNFLNFKRIYSIFYGHTV